MPSLPTLTTPQFIQRFQWLFNPWGFMEKNAKDYGDFFQTYILGKEPIIFISHPQAIQELFAASLEKLDARGSQLLKSFLGEKSLLLLSGTEHQRQRRLLTPPFYGDRMKAYGKTITDITKEVINKWQIGTPFSVRESIQEISLKVILHTVFGICEGERFRELEKLLCSLLNFGDTPLRAAVNFFPALQVDLGEWSPWGYFLRQREKIDQLLYAEIQERRDHPDPNRTDILSLMMSARDENGEAMTDVELRDELMTLLVAGHETTASAITWALYWIHHLPEVRENLLQELNNIDENTDKNEIFRLPYLTAVCNETLRIYPIAMITLPRIVKSPIEIMGYEFPPGSWLVGCIYSTHRRPDLYPEPEKFKPERFLEKQFAPYEYLPFGGGNRKCLGMSFALFEMKLVLATILSQLDFELVNNIPVKPVRRGVTSAPSGGKWLVAKGKRERVKTTAGV
ncbi:MAG: cytochrome P450 [Sphaerospermopsis kisseleviana]|jgi:unspecific monooxygenase|uniref:Cytochrome P450 n=1 Tax=Sphaerospermopsis reniformis TaxID=531300 RepID=A0A480ACL9_9CYAN|nr:cytochrome P450 [Sphaerospermopsis reniformis]GCL39884.1 cytochrome P450 [Sphaerospermopsis reniformis]